MGRLGIVGLLIISYCASAADSPFLFVWAADDDGNESDFVAVLDADPNSDSYGAILSTLEVGLPARAHHSEHRMPDGGMLFVNGFRTGNSYVVDLRNPLDPALVSHFTGVGALSHPHSFERLPNGNVLATFQNGPDGARVTGGVAELDPTGLAVRWTSAAHPDFPNIRPYSLAVAPEVGRALTTSADMWGEVRSDAVQIWQISDLSLKHTLRFLPGSRGDEHVWPLEPRLMPDGKTLIVNTAHCGLYQVLDPDSDSPRIEHIYSFERGEQGGCGPATIAANLWIQTVDARNGLVSLDVSNPGSPKEVGHLEFPAGHRPHWVAMEPNSGRIVVTGHGEMRNSVVMVKLDSATGSLSFDRKFGEDGVVDFGRTKWPHGTNGAAVPHGTVFSVP